MLARSVSKTGAKVFFTDDASAALTMDTVPGSGTNLYLYDEGQLTNLTSAAHADVQQVLGVSEDGSSVYFKAAGILTGVANQHGETAQSGQPNLYLSRGAATTFIVPGISPEAHLRFGRLRCHLTVTFSPLQID